MFTNASERFGSKIIKTTAKAPKIIQTKSLISLLVTSVYDAYPNIPIAKTIRR